MFLGGGPRLHRLIVNQSYLKDRIGSSDIKFGNPCLNALVQGDSWVTGITLGGIEDKLRRPNNNSLKRLSFACLFHKISKVSIEIKYMAWNFIVKSSTNSALDNTTVQTIHPLLTWQKHVNVVFPPVQIATWGFSENSIRETSSLFLGLTAGA